MASLDDSIISDQNLMLLDNVTNYTRASVDYFHHNFDYNKLEMSETWALLLKMRKHKLLRLPSCSSEDDDDYSMYLKRLHHCLWRRWAIHDFHLQDKKLDPLAINWNKETDVTVLYGPSLSKDIEQQKQEQENRPVELSLQGTQDVDDIKSVHSDTHLDYSSSYDSFSSSVESKTSSIFDSPSILKTNCSDSSAFSSSPKRKSLKFNSTVHRRDVDQRGHFLESEIAINDTDSQMDSYTTSLHHNSGSYHFYDFNSKADQTTLLFDEEDSDVNYVSSFNDQQSNAASSNDNHHHHHHHHHHNHVRTAVRH
ncbi:similar to Saccharomyces cerevisiae YOR062C Protein of unknown function [Maudiozyma barnettii]|uniref:Nitrogen regulatory protein areA GATA-like domain-containing protein n=1 Tax=Maudiozyma barnettii TaxID=61262 RepID=A0A8H2VJ73_9SACH|nr:hypothetical protein [Kazachstania barnettii]CAB4256274.1 similar to Saccharomyces cerevisiae YOR062C Protein of unknown function [Kazachstania barnettii]CAD1784883.1 similar to Saccharomyces cerevisiae YOR062C Protein of unknown function [Kazachstania barnettii]